MPIARETRREALTLDGFADCMGHEYRRKILFMLYQTDDGRLSVPDDLLNQDVDRDAFVLELTHSHLPKLEDADCVTWERERGVIRKGEKFKEIEPLLEVLSDYYEYIVPTFDPNQQL